MNPRLALVCVAAIAGLASFAATRGTRVPEPERHWYKGNTHTHTLNSDGDSTPDDVVRWYREHGYNFLVLSDHNFLTSVDGLNAVHGADDKFLVIRGEEVTDRVGDKPIHINGLDMPALVDPQHGTSVLDTVQRNVDAIRRAGGTPHINHPNFRWALTAEDIARVQGERFLEIYNGHPITWNYGDTNHASTERIWDIVLTRRLAELGAEPIWGTAVDDSHNYHQFKYGRSNPGRGWLMVRAEQLTPAALIAALEKGDFYASSGVRLKEVISAKDRLSLQIEPDEGVTYTTQFIGTRKGYDPTSEPVLGAEGQPVLTTRRYSKDIGTVLAEVKGLSPSYTLKGDEIYVRAKVISSKPKPNPTEPGDVECAWVQPVVR